VRLDVAVRPAGRHGSPRAARGEPALTSRAS
jgi:hypothetical protein